MKSPMLTESQRQARAGLIVVILVTALVLSALLWSTGCSKSDPTPINPAPRTAARPPFKATAFSVGTSMLPTFGEVELVQLELCGFGELRTGDTVIFWHDRFETYAHHRLIGRDETGHWLTQGDNNPSRDRGNMTSDEFVGRTHKL